MAYEPLHHKYRPQTFAQLVGQGAIATTLTNALDQGRIAPAYLFCGPRGTGKTSSARILAKSLNCLNHPGPSPAPCGTCEICRAIANGSALDFVEIDAASNTGVDNIRELIERAQFAPVQCRYKVYVIDECLTGDTLVHTQRGPMRIDDPNLEGQQVLSYNERTATWEYKRAVRWLNQGSREILEIRTNHRTIRCTGNHLIRTSLGWVAAKDVKEGTPILSPVPAAAAPLSTNMGQMGECAGLPEATNSQEIPTVKSLTASTLSLLRRKACAPSASVAAEKNWKSQIFFNKKDEVSAVSSPTGAGTPLRKVTATGSGERKTSWQPQVPSLPIASVSSMAPSWEMERSPSLINTAVSPDWLGPTAFTKPHGWSTKPAASRVCGRSSKSLPIRVTANSRSIATLPVIPTCEPFSLYCDRTVVPKPLLNNGSPEFLQKAGPGGIWTTDPLALAPKVARASNFIRKDTLPPKINSLPAGSPTWAMSPPLNPSCVGSRDENTTTSRWGLMPLEAGSQTLPITPFQQWHTSLETVVSVRPAGLEPVYDIEVEANHNFVANGLLVHNCHMLSTAAFNALLKTLEEPPDRVVFVLATTDPQRVLPTIISRCQRFDYRRIPLEAMVDHLQMIAEQEKIEIEPAALRLVAQVAQGGLRDAESLLDQLSLLEPPITAEKVWDLVGAVPERDLLELVGEIAAGNGSLVLEQARKLMDRGREPLIVLQNLAGFYRDLLIAKTASDRQDLVAVTPDTWTQMQSLAQTLGSETILVGQQHLRSAEVQVKNTTQPRLWLEVTLLGLLPGAMALQGRSLTIAPETPSQVSSRPAATTSRISTPPLSVPSQTPPPRPAPPDSTSVPPAQADPPAPPSATPAIKAASPTPPPGDSKPAATAQPQLLELWQQVLGAMQPFGTRALMNQQGTLLELDGQKARIGISSKPLFKMAQGRIVNVEAAFQTVLDRPVKVSLEVMPEGHTPPPANADDRPVRPSPSPPSPPPAAAESPPPAAPNQPDVSDPVADEAIAIEPVSPNGSTPLAPPPIAIDSDLDRAVKSFAQFFNGQIVDPDDSVTDESQTAGESTGNSAPESKSKFSGEPDRDVPF